MNKMVVNISVVCIRKNKNFILFEDVRGRFFDFFFLFWVVGYSVKKILLKKVIKKWNIYCIILNEFDLEVKWGKWFNFGVERGFKFFSFFVYN